MPDEIAERVRALEVLFDGFEHELQRSRRRLHALENTTAALVNAARERTAGEERRNRERINAENERAARFGRRVAVLTLVVAVAAVLVPATTLALHFLG